MKLNSGFILFTIALVYGDDAVWGGHDGDGDDHSKQYIKKNSRWWWWRPSSKNKK